MSFDLFAPVCINLLLCAAIIISSKHHLPATQESDLVYAYPSLLGYVLLLFTLPLAAVPLLPGTKLGTDLWVYVAIFVPFTLVEIVGAFYVFRYRFIIGSNSLVISDFWKEEIEFSRIVEVRHERIGRNWRVLIRLTNGRRVTVSGFVKGFSSLAKQLGDRVSASRSGTTSP